MRRMKELSDEIAPLMSFSGNGNPKVGGITSWITQRENELFRNGHFSDVGLWPDTQVPTFNQHGGTVASGFKATLRAGSIFSPQPGDIVYTTDGSDHVSWEANSTQTRKSM